MPDNRHIPADFFRFPFTPEYMFALGVVEKNFSEAVNMPQNRAIVNALTEEFMQFIGKKIEVHGYAPVVIASSAAVGAMAYKISEGIEKLTG